MGNALSNQSTTKKATKKKPQHWNWDFKNGRAFVKPRRQAPPPRPLFRRQPSDNYDLWIFNPDPPRRND